MKNFAKISLCVLLVASILFSLVGCSQKAELTEENVTETVAIAQDSLKNFDTKALKKYVDSQTLNYIVELADKHDQFDELGRAMFSSLSMEVVAVDLDAKTVTVDVMNKDLYMIASNFAYELTTKYSTMQLLSLLGDDYFLDNSLSKLTESIGNEPEPYEKKTVTLNIVEGKRNLVLSVDEVAEDAISGGAVYAVKGITG